MAQGCAGFGVSPFIVVGLIFFDCVYPITPLSFALDSFPTLIFFNKALRVPQRTARPHCAHHAL